MKRACALLLIVVSPLAGTFAQRRTKPGPILVKTTYDKFRDVTLVSTRDLSFPTPILATVSFTYSGTKAPASVESYRVVLTAPAHAWTGSDPSRQLLLLLVDNKTPAQRIWLERGGVFTAAGNIWQIYSTTISTTIMVDWACAQSLEVSIGSSQAKLTSRDQSQLLALLKASKNSCPK